MANWAKAQEDTTDLPVFKRARYGIHFQRPDGQIEAVFSGKPCHHFEGNEWKPIDTGLAIGKDGWYGAPHSDIKIHPDGRVRIDKSDYQQFTKLPSAQAGRLAGDRIIKDFPGGEQHLVMKEDGFREEIHVFKPTFPIEKFIAKTTGNLPSKYRAHPITAEDAEGNSYEFTGDVKAFGAWLDKAVYPVVIDPDLVLQPDEAAAQDTYINMGAKDTAYATSTTLFIRKYTSSTEALISLLKFDLSSIPMGANISSATLSTTRRNNATRTSQIVYHRILSGNDGWVEACTWNYAVPTTQAWAGSAGALTSGTDYAAAALGTQVITIGDASGLQYDTPLDVTEVGYMVANNYGFLAHYYAGDIVMLASSNNGTASARPKLAITYTSGGIPKHFMHYQRMRSL